jgi:hypothetical protein
MRASWYQHGNIVVVGFATPLDTDSLPTWEAPPRHEPPVEVARGGVGWRTVWVEELVLEAPRVFPPKQGSRRETYHLDQSVSGEVVKLAEEHGLRDNRNVPQKSRVVEIAVRFFWEQPRAVREAAIDEYLGTPAGGVPAPKTEAGPEAAPATETNVAST